MAPQRGGGGFGGGGTGENGQALDTIHASEISLFVEIWENKSLKSHSDVIILAR